MADHEIMDTSSEIPPDLGELILRYWGRQLRRAKDQAAATDLASAVESATVTPALAFTTKPAKQLKPALVSFFHRPLKRVYTPEAQRPYAKDGTLDWTVTETGTFEDSPVEWQLHDGRDQENLMQRKLIVTSGNPVWFDQIVRMVIQGTDGTDFPIYIALRKILSEASGQIHILASPMTILPRIRLVDPTTLTVEEAKEESERIRLSREQVVIDDPDANPVWDTWLMNLHQPVRAALLASEAPTEQIVIDLLEALKQSQDRDKRWNIAEQLGGMGAAAATEPVVSGLVEMLTQSDDQDLRACAAEILGKMGAAAATITVLTVLIQAMRQPQNRYLRATAAEALGKMSAAAAAIPVLSGLVEMLTQSDDQDLRACAAEALGKIGEAAATPAVLTALMEAFTQAEDNDLQWETASALGQMGEAAATPEVLAALMQAFTQQEDEHLRQVAAKALQQVHPVS